LSPTAILMLSPNTALRIRALVVVLACSIVGRNVSAQNTIVQGTVRGDSGDVITTASVTVTPAGAGATASVSARTNAAGKWSLSVPGHAAEYFVTISALGWTQARI